MARHGIQARGSLCPACKKTGEHPDKDQLGLDVTVDDYELSYASQAQSAFNGECGPNEGGRFSIYSYTSTVTCLQNFEEIKINLEKLRFLSVYLYGYVDGQDNNDNTPFVKAGPCVKIPN
jgi:hypothetical protein